MNSPISFDIDKPEFAEQLNLFVGDLAKRLRNPIPTAILTLGGLPLTYTHFAWPFHESSAGADTSLVHGQVNLAVPDAEGKPSPLHAKIAAAMTVTFREIVKAPEQPFSESFILNAVRKTFDQGQLELVKSGNRQPVPVTTRYYSPWQKRFSFNDTTEAQRHQFLAAKAYWFSAVLGGNAPVWLADPRDAQYLNTTPEDLKKSAAALAKEGLVTLAKDPEFASATPALVARAEEFQAHLGEALSFIKPHLQRRHARRPHQHVTQTEQPSAPCSTGVDHGVFSAWMTHQDSNHSDKLTISAPSVEVPMSHPVSAFLLLASLGIASLTASAQSTLHTYRNAALHLVVDYPSTLDAEDPGNTDGYSYRTRFALHPDADPESKGADPCSPLLLSVGMGPDQPLDAKKAKAGKVTPLQPTGGLTVNEIKLPCLARDNSQQTPEKNLSDLVENSRHLDGLKPMPRALTFDVQGAKVIFAASSGPTVDEKGRRSGAAGTTYTGTAAALIDNRAFFFTFTTNDLAVFNHMLASHVCFTAPSCPATLPVLVPYEFKPAP